MDYVWYFRKMKHANALCFAQQIESSVAHLLAFLSDARLSELLRTVQVVVHGVHVPALDNAAMRRKLYGHFMRNAKLSQQYLDRRLVLPSHRERTQMALQFNRVLERKCREKRVLFVQVATDIVDRGTGVVQQQYVKRNDVHLEPESLVAVFHASTECKYSLPQRLMRSRRGWMSSGGS